MSVCGSDSGIHHPRAQISISSRGTGAARSLTLTKPFCSREGNTEAQMRNQRPLTCGLGESEATASLCITGGGNVTSHSPRVQLDVRRPMKQTQDQEEVKTSGGSRG